MNIFFGALDASNFCSKEAIQNLLGLGGLVITIFKWAVPIMLIIISIFDLGSAVVSQKPDDIKKTYSGLIKRAIAALIIFFIPSIVGLLMDAVDGNDNTLSQCTEKLGLKL